MAATEGESSLWSLPGSCFSLFLDKALLVAEGEGVWSDGVISRLSSALRAAAKVSSFPPFLESFCWVMGRRCGCLVREELCLGFESVVC